MKEIIRTVIVLLTISWLGCEQKPAETDQDYVEQINQWHRGRVERLVSPTGWMSLAGLFWLNEGENTFGADSSNDIVFPAGKAPDFIGSFVLENGIVRAKILPGVNVLHEGNPVNEIEMKSDAEGKPTILSHGTLSWFIIKRTDGLAVRLRDTKNPVIESFHGIERYPVDPGWRIEATFEPYNPARSISVPNVFGTIDEEPCPGALVFELEGKTYRLDVIGEMDDEEFFVIFGDETNKDETYPAGRYVYVKNPGSGGKTYIDFNKAYNPPCAFTEFATCPFPPEQNILPLRIETGEKAYH